MGVKSGTASDGSSGWWRRLLIATVAGYLAGYAVEAALGHWDPTRVGWSASFVPVVVEGAVFGFVLRGVWGVVLAPLPLLLVPETWIRISRLWELVGPQGLLILIQPLPPMWAAGFVGVVLRRFAPWRTDS